MDPAQDKRAQRRKRQREYYAEKGKEVRRNYYLANIEEKRRASREYHRKRRELFKEYERIALAVASNKE
jgi:hypothetical protein|tara:strand:- start:680 stop:886 length:207 start_codon:yes stop_codon:yes gene_type:complete